MRLWSLHPSYLDTNGLVALWRESLLAQKVLRGRTRGYRNHPQLKRFQVLDDPVAAIGSYLEEIYREGVRRGYCFDGRKISRRRTRVKIIVTSGQLEFEYQHLRRKLWNRDRRRYWKLAETGRPKSHPSFVLRPGLVEKWEAAY
jgi:hypothetical protein